MREIFSDAESIVSWEVDIKPKDLTVIKMAFLLYQDNHPAALRFTLPNSQDGIMPEKYLPIIQESKEHFLSIYRLNYDPQGYFELSMWNFVEVNSPPSMSIKTDLVLRPPNSGVIRDTFTSSFKYRHSLKLIADAQDERIPLQYRFLSLFLFLEETFKTAGKWNYSDAHKRLDFVSERLNRLGYTRKPLSTFIDIRDRCAHIKSDKDVRGITQISNKSALQIIEVLPVLTDACVAIFNEQSGEIFKLGKRQP